MRKKNKTVFLRKKNKIFTKNLVPHQKIYGERLYDFNKVEYREWNPYKSKVGAAILKSSNIDMNLFKNGNILYLGASSGTTVSHLSDMNMKKIFAIETAYEMGVYLVALSRVRKNIFPIIEDARKTNVMKRLIGKEKIDLVIQDIPGKFQTDLITEVGLSLLNKKCIVYYSVKLSSIDSKKTLKEILDEEVKSLRKVFNILHILSLEPYEKNHYFLIMRKK